jgi:hypothetical protein
LLLLLFTCCLQAHLPGLKLDVRILGLQLADIVGYNLVARVNFKSEAEVLISFKNSALLIQSFSSQVQSLEVVRFNSQELIHKLYGRLKLINFDVTAGTEEVTIFDYVIDLLVLLIKLLIEL